MLRFDETSEDDGEIYMGKYHVVHSSGSTGPPRYFVYDNVAWEQMLIGIIRGARAEQRFLDINTPLTKWSEAVREFRPNIIIGYPSAIKILAELTGREKEPLYIRRVISCGEPLSIGLRKFLENAFRTEVINFYGASESLALGVERRTDEGMILFDDLNVIDKTRAAIWYAENGDITDSVLGGIKAVRECAHIRLECCQVESQEFGWKSQDIELIDTDIVSEYLFMDSRDVKLRSVKMKGKYSFQYMENLEIDDCELDTKDAFWHSKNVTVKDSIVKGEYLGWFSENLTLIGCKIIGTQPLCYCKNLKLVNCTMEDTDLSYEYSDVEADVKGHIISIKNPKSGRIIADSVGEIIRGDAVMECTGEVILRAETEKKAV